MATDRRSGTRNAEVVCSVNNAGYVGSGHSWVSMRTLTVMLSEKSDDDNLEGSEEGAQNSREGTG